MDFVPVIFIINFNHEMYYAYKATIICNSVNRFIKMARLLYSHNYMCSNLHTVGCNHMTITTVETRATD